MTQKRKPYLRILTHPEDLSGIMKKVRRIRYEKARKILVIAVLLLLAVCGTYLLMKNQSYGRARTAHSTLPIFRIRAAMRSLRTVL